MLNWNTDDTICAIASGAGAGKRGIVRLSGPMAIDIANQISRSSAKSHSAEATWPTDKRAAAILYKQGEVFLGERLGWLEAESYWWHTHRSYTGQASVEFHLLGSLPLLESLLEQCCSRGARIAQPGEFTLRAFLAGRMDLSQAEAVLGVINARGEFELQRALDQLAGGLAKPVAKLRADLINALAHLEAGLDFVDEDIEFISAAELRSLLTAALMQVRGLLQQLEARHVSYGTPKVVLVGRPNAGKSSLFNSLLEGSTAIVSDQRGTTRDYVVSPMRCGTVDLELVDTAGLDDALDSEIDVESQARTKSQIEEATFLIHMMDATGDLAAEWAFFLASTQTIEASHKFLVVNKIDVVPDDRLGTWKSYLATTDKQLEFSSCHFISTYDGAGVEVLRQELENRLSTFTNSESMGMLPTTAHRCRDSLQRCEAALQGALDMIGTKMIGEELIAAEIRLAMEELGWIAGEVYTDDLLDRIFSQFCIGK